MNCWLLVADLEDSTQFLKTLPPEQAPLVTDRWLATCKQIVEDHQGAINKFLGDGFLAYWTERGKTTEAVARALAAFQLLRSSAETPRFRTALHYGKVFVGGEASLGEESLMGAEVNFAFRMEKLASQLAVSCLLSQPAQSRLGSLIPTQEHGRHPLASFDGDFLFFTTEASNPAGN